MSAEPLTSYNPLLSELTKSDLTHFRAIPCKPEQVRGVQDYIQASLAENTRIAYLSDLAHFENWGGQLPAAAETVAEYLAAHADSLSVATLNRRLAALSLVHRSKGLTNPTTSELVKSVVRGVKRVKGT